MTPIEHRATFPSTPASAGEARRFVESILAGAHLDSLAYTATLLVSELVANAVLHTATPVEVIVKVDGTIARIEVHDGSPQLPTRKNYSAMSGTGRGLVMVDRMATRWGAELTPTGKVVWFEVDTDGASAFDFLEVEVL
jgi:anti-sigma regulatory factor (Ser/Thr protein kinase)